MPTKKKASPQRKATIVTSDWHFGDAAQLLRSWRHCHVELTPALIRNFQPDEVEVIVNGDMIAGSGIFRDQAKRNVEPNPFNQALWAAWEFDALHRVLLDICEAVRVTVVWGNHDDAENFPMAESFVDQLRLMSHKARLYPVSALGSFACTPRPGTYWHASHGFGHSDYYPRTYSDMRDMMRLHSEYTTTDEVSINHFLRAHSHHHAPWLPVQFNVWAHTTGGWHRQDRWNIGRSIRNTGTLLFLDGGEFLTCVPIFADADLLVEESRDRYLPQRTRQEMGRVQIEAMQWKEGLG